MGWEDTQGSIRVILEEWGKLQAEAFPVVSVGRNE